MDRVDVAIFRELARDQILWWGNLDPRLAIGEIAHRVGVGRKADWSHLREWRTSGFLAAEEVIPSPALFGAEFGGGSLRVADPRAKASVLTNLGLVAGVVGAVDHVGPWISPALVHEPGESLERTRRLLARLRGVAEVTPCVPFSTPPVEVSASPVDWRILASCVGEDGGRSPRSPELRG